MSEQTEIKKEEVQPVEEKKEEEKKPEEKKETGLLSKPESEKTEEEKTRYVHPYWYPMEDGETNPILDSLKKNVTRGSASTVAIQYTFNTLFVLIPLFIIYKLFKFYTTFLVEVNGSVLVPENKVMLMIGVGILLAAVAAIGAFIARRRRPVYLVDFATSIPDPSLRATTKMIENIIVESGLFEQEYIDFQLRLLHRTGLGEETYLPRPFHERPLKTNMALSREECQVVMKCACDQLFKQTGIDPTKDIDIVICNCSLFNPTPSIAAMLMNMYKCKQTCKDYNLAGMGCSAGLVSIDLARDLLDIYPNINLLVFSTENITQNWYAGKMKGMLISNTLFRMGGAAILLSNKRQWKSKAKFQLMTTVRIVHAKYDDSYHAVFQYEDDEGKVGVKIGRELLKCVTRALIQNMNILMPQVMTYKDICRYLIDFIHRKISKSYKETAPEFKPNFRETFQAYCIHAGGRAIIDGLQESLGLTDEDCMPSRATLYRFGNTSSSSVWYEMKFIERIRTLKKGDKVWQVAFGSGLKCNSAIWLKIKDY